MNERATHRTDYDLKSVTLPRLSGIALRILTWLLESPLGVLVQSSLVEKSGIKQFRKLKFDEPPTLYPAFQTDIKVSADEATPPLDSLKPVEVTGTGFHFNNISDYARTYREGKLTPVDIAEKLISAIEDGDTGDRPLRAFIAVNREDVLKQAEAATQRIKNGNPLSILDGVPVSIKDQLDMIPYPTTVGTSFLGSSAVTEDATAVARLRAAGALLIGKTNMHELGLGVTGLNPHHGVTRNPYNPHHHTGGSSSGSAAAVAAGLGPVSIGADGGGSIRIPSSLCGVVGLKPTFRRVSEHGDAPFGWSVDHLGPIAVTAADAAIAYAVIAGPDPKDRLSLNQPPPVLQSLENTSLDDLTIGIYPEWFRHADSETVSTCEKLLDKLVERGATIREIAISGLEAGRVAHTITIATEITHAMEPYYAEYGHTYGLDVRLNLALTRRFLPTDYLRSQQARTRQIEEFNRVLEDVNVIITPTTGIPAPEIPEKTLPEGESDLTSLFEIMRFMTPANFTGLPAISFPAGYNSQGLPVGMQAIGIAWQEDILLRLALVSESIVERRKPEVFYDLLDGGD